MICVFLLICSVGCTIFPDGSVNKTKNNIDVTTDKDGNISGILNDKIKVNAQLSDIAETGSAYNINLKTRTADEVVSKSNAESLAKIIGTEITGYELNGDNRRYTYNFANKSTYGDGDYVFYKSNDAFRYAYYLEREGHNSQEDFPLEELEGFTFDEAIKKIKEILNIYNDIEVSEEPDVVYVLDAEHINAFLSAENELTDESRWDEDDEVYYIEYSLIMNMQTAETAKIRECDEETIYVYLACDGTYIYMDSLPNKLKYKRDSSIYKKI